VLPFSTPAGSAGRITAILRRRQSELISSHHAQLRDEEAGYPGGGDASVKEKESRISRPPASRRSLVFSNEITEAAGLTPCSR
jgi:hypothetical protein